MNSRAFIHTHSHMHKKKGETKFTSLQIQKTSGQFLSVDQFSVRIKEKNTLCCPICSQKVRLKVKGHKWLLVSSHQECCGRGPYRCHKSRNIPDHGNQKSNILSPTCPCFLFVTGRCPSDQGHWFFLIQLEESFFQPIMMPSVLRSPLSVTTKCQRPLCFLLNPNLDA